MYDFRVGQHFTLRQRPLTRDHLDEFVKAYRPGQPRDTREPGDRFRAFELDELLARDKINLDLTWLRDPALDGADDLLPPEVIAQEIVEDLQSALAEFTAEDVRAAAILPAGSDTAATVR